MTQIVDKKLKLMCDCCKSHFDKPCAWLSLGNEYCTEIMEIQKELEEKNKEIERLNNIIDELEKWLEDYIKLFNQPDMLEEQTLEDLKEVLDKLKALKEGKDNER